MIESLTPRVGVAESPAVKICAAYIDFVRTYQ